MQVYYLEIVTKDVEGCGLTGWWMTSKRPSQRWRRPAPMEIPGHGTFAIYVQGGNDHGFWQR